MKTKLFVAIALILGLSISGAQAQVRSQRAQKAPIAQGVRSGELNRHETHRLVREQHRIHRHKRMARRNDGHIGPRERKMLAMEKRRSSRHIYHYKHNQFGRK